MELTSCAIVKTMIGQRRIESKSNKYIYWYSEYGNTPDYIKRNIMEPSMRNNWGSKRSGLTRYANTEKCIVYLANTKAYNESHRNVSFYTNLILTT